MDIDEPLLLKDVHYYMSDDSKHDTFYIQQCLMHHWNFLKLTSTKCPSNHIIWSDNCNGQFKSVRCWYFVSRYPKLTVSDGLEEGCQLCRNFFATGHGKGEVDGAGTLLKREVHKKQLKPDGPKLQNCLEIIRFLQEETNKFHHAHPRARQQLRRHFWEIKKGHVDRVNFYRAGTNPGSKKMHQVRLLSPRDPTLLQIRELMCFCTASLDSNTALQYWQRDHIPVWRLVRIKSKQPSRIRALYDEDEEVEAGSGREWMADSLLVGDNIVVRACNDENDKFWIMLVCKGAHRVEDAFVDDAGNEYIPGNMVISKYWYERYSRPRSHSYFLRDNWAIVYVYTHIVVVPKFSMLPILGGLK
jgi:hypothetical protein